MQGYDVHEVIYLNCEIHDSMTPGPDIQVLGPGHNGRIMKMYLFNILFFRTITVMGNKVVHCCYVHYALMLNCERHCPGHWAEVKTFLS